jgi:hypothetical protein
MLMVQFSSGYITIRGGGAPLLVGFTNSDWTDDPVDQKKNRLFHLIKDLSLGPVRKNRLLYFLQQKQSTDQQ